ncbi:MAG: leucine-rich repeat domain-containing protein [Porcipelethomonas sp.]
MNFKKFAAVIAASALVCFSSFSMVYAEEDSDTASEEETSSQTESETLLSSDSLWEYTIGNDEETNEEYASLDKYLGSDAEISIPSEVDGITVRKLGTYTFYENTTVTKINIPETITDFGDFSFFGCPSLKEFFVDENNELYTADNGILIGKDGLLFICYPPAKTETEYTIPDGVVALNPAAFATCTNLKTVNFPDSLERMGLYCFAECTSLNNVVIPESVTELSQFNFCGCTSLTDITLPDTMHTIGDGAFFACTALDKIDFPDYIQQIGQCAFVSTGFTEIEVPATVQEIGYSAFGYTTDEQGLLVEMDGFVVKGLTGSAAQAYCGENENVTFESTDSSYTEASGETETDSENSDNEESSGLKPGVVVAICVGGVVVVIAVIIIVKVILSSRTGTDDADEEDDDESDDSDSDEPVEDTEDDEDEYDD